MPYIPDLNNFRMPHHWDTFAANYPIAISLATQGNHFTNPELPTFLTEADQRGIYPITYHFLERGNAEGQADYYAARWQGEGIALDIELNPATGLNPTITDANDWFNRVSKLTGVPRSQMICYINRSWYHVHGLGSTLLNDTVLWVPQYTGLDSLDWKPFGGWDHITFMQFADDYPVAGLDYPPGADMSVCYMDSMDFLRLIGLVEKDDPVTPAEIEKVAQRTFQLMTQMLTMQGAVPAKGQNAGNYWAQQVYFGVRQHAGEVQGQVTDVATQVANISDQLAKLTSFVESKFLGLTGNDDSSKVVMDGSEANEASRETGDVTHDEEEHAEHGDPD